ncbi:MAG: TolC family protein [Chitinophagaceae bacterium]|nr:TolC family protein [Chitinophagaceae bacterium]MCW5929097.1 TolC family protein [Chitinophagaceae bacterium]
MNNFIWNLRRKTILLVVLVSTGICVNAQQLSIDSCYVLATKNFPAIKKYALLERSAQYGIENAARGYLPQANISGQATYQSQTIDLSKAMGGALPPGISIPEISRDQYKVQAEVTQAVYDGGVIHNRKKMLDAADKLQQQQVEVTVYAVKDRVNQLFFSILLMDEQYKQNNLRRADLQNAAEKTEAALANGTAFRSSLNELRAELVNVDMVSTELKANRYAYVQMLSVLTGMPLRNEVELVMPLAPVEIFDITGRPELKLYDYQKQLYDVEESNLRSDYTPRLNAFIQGAYGRPTLNFVENKFGAWYMGGLRLQWNFGSLYGLKNNKRILEINRQLADVDRETFLFNTEVSIRQQKAVIDKYKELISQDYKLIELRNAVKISSRAQLDNGVITTRDFIAQVNAESLARQSLALHSIQLLQAQYNLNYISGN